MGRRFATRDLSLTVRMAVALAGIGLVYLLLTVVLVAALVHGILSHDVGLALGALMFLAAVPWLLWQHYTSTAEDVLRLTKARPAPAGDRFVPAAERLAATADLRPPDVIVAPSKLPNALVVPTRGKPLVILTSALVERLTPEETESVIAHELTHLANRDAAVMTFVSGPALAFSRMWHDDGRGKLFVAFLSPVWLLCLLFTRGVSRYREYTADRGAALLTAPQQLMSALTKIHGVEPAGDLRGVSALCIRGIATPWLPLLADHPPLEKRLARLAVMARIQGKPVGP
jgi:heat shock protein HtpX